MIEQVAQRTAQGAVGLHQALIKLVVHPLVQLLHGRSAVGLVVEQPLLGRHLLLSAVRIMGVDLGQNLDHVAAGLGEVLCHVNYLAPTVGEAF